MRILVCINDRVCINDPLMASCDVGENSPSVSTLFSTPLLCQTLLRPTPRNLDQPSPSSCESNEALTWGRASPVSQGIPGLPVVAGCCATLPGAVGQPGPSAPSVPAIRRRMVPYIDCLTGAPGRCLSRDPEPSAVCAANRSQRRYYSTGTSPWGGGHTPLTGDVVASSTRSPRGSTDSPGARSAPRNDKLGYVEGGPMSSRSRLFALASRF